MENDAHSEERQDCLREARLIRREVWDLYDRLTGPSWTSVRQELMHASNTVVFHVTEANRTRNEAERQEHRSRACDSVHYLHTLLRQLQTVDAWDPGDEVVLERCKELGTQLRGSLGGG